MTQYQPTAAKIARTIVQLLVLATVAMTAAVIFSACSSEQPSPTPKPQRTDQSPTKTIEALTNEIAALRATITHSAETPTTQTPQTTEKPATTAAPKTATPDPTATLPPPKNTSPSDNICRRTPGVQNALIHHLQMSSCRIITIDELFRLNTKFTAGFIESPRQGDFAGMTNLRQLEIRFEIPEGETATIPAQLFHGMTKLETLEIDANGKLTISSNAVHNLPNLKSIRVESSGLQKEFASELPRLTHLSISMEPNSHLKPHALNNLERVTDVNISWSVSYSSGIPTRDTMGQIGHLPKMKNLTVRNAPTIQPNTFMNLPALETLNISAQTLRLNDDSFSNNSRLTTIELSARTSGYRTAFQKLEKLEYLEMYDRPNSSSDRKKPEILLSPKSPLMKAILNGQKSPEGYIVIPPGGE